MKRQYFLDLVDYMTWTNNIIIDWLKQTDDQQWERFINSSFSTIKQTVIHIVSAEKIWLDIWNNVPGPFLLSARFKGSKNDLIEIWEKSSSDLKIFIENYPETDYHRIVAFRWRGEEWRMEFWQTFSHFINHATYHRGQLVTQLRQAGFTKFSSTDLATYYHVVKNIKLKDGLQSYSIV